MFQTAINICRMILKIEQFLKVFYILEAIHKLSRIYDSIIFILYIYFQETGQVINLQKARETYAAVFWYL